MSTTLKKRSAYWDNIKGILMFLVVFAHILFQLQDKSELINSVVDYIYMFHMPAFVFVSGYLGKSERSHSFEGIIKLIFPLQLGKNGIGSQPVLPFSIFLLKTVEISEQHRVEITKINRLVLRITKDFSSMFSDQEIQDCRLETIRDDMTCLFVSKLFTYVTFAVTLLIPSTPSVVTRVTPI